jgi:hypothetical protein
VQQETHRGSIMASSLSSFFERAGSETEPSPSATSPSSRIFPVLARRKTTVKNVVRKAYVLILHTREVSCFFCLQ